jgi:hypothetical protein
MIFALRRTMVELLRRVDQFRQHTFFARPHWRSSTIAKLLAKNLARMRAVPLMDA